MPSAGVVQPRREPLGLAHRFALRSVWVRRAAGWIAAVGLPLALTASARGFFPTDRFGVSGLLLASVVVVAYLAGTGTAVVAGVVSTLAMDWFLVEPTSSVIVGGGQAQSALVLFLASSVLAAFVIGAVEQSRTRAALVARRLACLQQLTTALAGTRTLDDVRRTVIDLGVAAAGASAGSICERDPDGTVHVLFAAGYDPATTDAFASFPVHSELPLAVAIREAVPLFLGSRLQVERRFPGLEQWVPPDNEALCALPLAYSGWTTAAIGLSFGTVQTFDEGQREFLLAIAGQIEAALARAGLDEQRAATMAREADLLARLARLAATSLAISSSKGLDDLLRCATDEAAAIIDCRWTATSLVAGIGPHGAVVSVHPQDATDLYETAIRQAEVEANPRGWLAAPLVSRTGTNLGMLQCTDKRYGEFTAQDEAVLVQLAQLTAAAVENGRALADEAAAREDAERAQERLELLAAISLALISSLDFNEALERLTQLVVPHLVDACVVYLRQTGDPSSLGVAVAHHRDETQLADLVDLVTAYPPSLDAARAAAGLTIDFGGDAHGGGATSEAHRAWIVRLGLRSEVLIPLVAREEVLGAVSFLTVGTRTLAQHDVALLKDVADRAALALVNARLVADQLRTSDLLRFQSALLTTQAEAGMEGQLIVSPTSEVLSSNSRFAEMWGLPADLMERGLDDELLAVAMRQVRDPEAFLAHVDACYANPVRAVRDEVDLVDGRVFDRWGAPLRGQDGTYLGWAWYFRDVTDHKRVSDALREAGRRSADLARTLQQSLLPARLPDVPGLDLAARYQPAGSGLDVGGDFYDVFAIGGDRWVFTIGDVCGKGAAAATVTAAARHTVRAASMHSDSPADILRQLNEVMLLHGSTAAAEPDGQAARFFTMVHAIGWKDPAGGFGLRLAVGGHPLPLVRRVDGTVEHVGTAGTLIGVVPNLDLTDTELHLAPGESLVLVTDGVIEAHDDEHYLDEGSLATLLAAGSTADSAAATACRVERAALAIQGGAPRDDIAILVVRATD